mmetsp:Transcript_11269/g.24229  ORF Transcript_11269/g.24229 Transcript_11269/m.24229 type:complete len:128 (-) Transcript_11269:108-491(-)
MFDFDTSDEGVMSDSEESDPEVSDGSLPVEDESDSDDEAYDSEDPERWGPYYWNGDREENIGLQTKAKDYVKYASFKTLRHLTFAGDVMVHFFGLNNWGNQWLIDSIEKENRIEKEQVSIDVYLLVL